ncbi:hypothetical protein DL766_009903 [Monosporascus sp. MC13-8B]|uniref:Uncharacterized protein n=1 Tax=Monosporascus cannonballus TaxID=155416 RepID=A0ABY0HHV8_9PEZI|nr:hypothetical protein DL763_009549 [Monosporascus cannonballus]RYO91121.1 hypothetical protein DL762_002417 [Monosporascus cannonballus]RYP12937.1 hypothetical protein DL766_009903 [Monosporascus sp. MC13-8B]
MAPDPDKRVSLTHWLIVGGMGPPPTAASLLRMSSERKACYREENGFQEERKKALAEFERQWGPTGFARLAANVLGSNKRNKLGRDEVMKTYGPGGSKRKNITKRYTVSKGNSADDEGAGAAGGASGDADAAGAGVGETADPAGAGGATGDDGVEDDTSPNVDSDAYYSASPGKVDGYTNSDLENIMDTPAGSSAVQL